MRVHAERRGADGQRRAEQALRPRPRGARGGGQGDRRGVRRAHEKLFSLITNTLAKDKEIIDTVAALSAPRQLPQPRQHGRGRGGGRAGHGGRRRPTRGCRTAITRMKAKWLGLEKLQHWDRNAPLPDDDDRAIPWDEARNAGAGRLWRVRARAGRDRRGRSSTALDRRGAAARQVRRRVRASDRAVRASVSAAELSRPHARRDDAGA